jgi:hypothetical protein
VYYNTAVSGLCVTAVQFVFTVYNTLFNRNVLTLSVIDIDRSNTNSCLHGHMLYQLLHMASAVVFILNAAVTVPVNIIPQHLVLLRLC